MYLKKIILISLFSWSFVSRSDLLAWDLGNLKNSSTDRDTVIKIAVVCSTFWIISKFIQYACTPGLKMPEQADPLWKKIGYGVQRVGADGGIFLVAKTAVMSYAAWNLKNYYYQK